MSSSVALLDQIYQVSGSSLSKSLADRVKKHLTVAGGDVSAISLAGAWTGKVNREWVLDTLEQCHPCVTAVLLTQGQLSQLLGNADAVAITESLVARKIKENEDRNRYKSDNPG